MPRNKRSFLTLMIYLDAPEKGGETNFLSPDDPSRVTAVAPATGVALAFEHQLLHEGALVRQGCKHAIRTDVMYRRREPPPTVEAAERETSPPMGTGG